MKGRLLWDADGMKVKKQEMKGGPEFLSMNLVGLLILFWCWKKGL